MLRARPYPPRSAAAPESGGRACVSGFILPPLIVILFGAAMLALAPVPVAPGLKVEPPTPGGLRISAVFTPQVQYWNQSIVRWAAASGLDPNLVAVVMQIESCGDPSARSTAGAVGLFQVMPYHFYPADNPYAPDTNALRGLAYLKRSLAAANNGVRLALAGYNGGISVISQAESLWPPETIRYAYWGSGIYQDVVNGNLASPRLDEWLAAGGESMCSRATQVLQL